MKGLDPLRKGSSRPANSESGQGGAINASLIILALLILKDLYLQAGDRAIKRLKGVQKAKTGTQLFPLPAIESIIH